MQPLADLATSSITSSNTSRAIAKPALKSSEPSSGIAAVIKSRYPVRTLFQKVLECVHEQVNSQSLYRAKSLAEDLGVTSGQLDRKLRHSSGLRTYITSLLQELVNFASETSPPSALSWSPTKINDKVRDADLEAQFNNTLSTLITFSSTLKDATPSDDIERLSQAVREDIFTRFDVDSVQKRFPKCNPKLHRRIGALNRLRRLRSQDSQFKFKRTVTNAMERERESKQRSTSVSGEPQQPLLLDDDRVPLSELLEEFGASNSDSEASSVTSSSNSSGYGIWNSSHDDPDDVGIMEPQSVHADNKSLSIPQIPLNSRPLLGDESNCPFCMMILNKDITQVEWKEHVLDDIEPFMCTFGGCSQSYRTYSSRDDWQHHEDSVHRITAVWVCHDCNETLSSADSFQTHLRSTHQSLFPEKHLLAITKMCRTVRADEGPRQHCILCGANLTTKQDEYDHLATHLIDLALLVFPGADQPANDLDDSISEVFEQPRTIEGLEWFREFSNDDVIPFEYVRNLGHGAFAQVEARRCTIGPTAGTIYACKTFLIAQRNRGAMKQQIQAEVTILRRLQHVHIISIVGAYVQRRRIVLIQLPVFDFNLEQFLELVWDDEATLRGKWFGCLVSALAYLHAMRIRHKDVKPSNIGVKNGSVIMSDFSIATEFEEEGSDSTGRPDAYTGKYAPPEVLQYDVRSRSSDIFSLGCIFFEMLTAFGKEVTAFYKKDNSKLPAWYAKDTERLQETILHLKKLPVEIQPVAQICSSMVSLKRQARPSAQQVLDALMVYNLVGKCALSSSLVDFDAGDTASVHTVT